MRMSTLVSASVVAIALAATMSSVSASGQSATPGAAAMPAVATATPTPPESRSTQFATLKDVKAVPMASNELDAVKGLHIHFVTPGNNVTGPFGSSLEGWHFVNHQQNNLGNGQALPGSGPGYSGLCTAVVRSPSLVIPGPGGTTIGIGSGC